MEKKLYVWLLSFPIGQAYGHKNAGHLLCLFSTCAFVFICLKQSAYVALNEEVSLGGD